MFRQESDTRPVINHLLLKPIKNSKEATIYSSERAKLSRGNTQQETSVDMPIKYVQIQSSPIAARLRFTKRVIHSIDSRPKLLLLVQEWDHTDHCSAI